MQIKKSLSGKERASHGHSPIHSFFHDLPTKRWVNGCPGKKPWATILHILLFLDGANRLTVVTDEVLAINGSFAVKEAEAVGVVTIAVVR